jgi:hypothetical protein
MSSRAFRSSISSLSESDKTINVSCVRVSFVVTVDTVFDRNVSELFVVFNGDEDDCTGRTTACTTDAIGEDCISCDGGFTVSVAVDVTLNGEDGRVALAFKVLMVQHDGTARTELLLLVPMLAVALMIVQDELPRDPW